MIKKVTTFKHICFFLILPACLSIIFLQNEPATGSVMQRHGQFAADPHEKAALQTITIADARKQPVRSQVKVAGRVTVGNQFGAPAYIQDSTGGIAVYDAGFADSVAIGDSVQVSGTLREYQNLLELENVTFSIVQTSGRIIDPRVITAAAAGESYEGELITIRDATIDHAGAFAGNVSYTLSDSTGSLQLRIDSGTNLAGSIAPNGETDITGILSQYKNDYELMPRSVQDVGVGSIIYPGADIPMDETFDVATWNMDWFGNTGLGPQNDLLQLKDALRVIRHINADLYALEEVSNPAMFRQLLDSLPDYRGFEADYSQQQKTAFLYKTTTIDSISSGLITKAGNSYNWASGRYPLEFTFTATVNGASRTIYAFVIHAKASTDAPASDYDRRVQAAKALKNYLDQYHKDDNVILLGDYNDDVDLSIYKNQPSPYASFLADPEDYDVITYPLSEERFSSSVDGPEMIDHITISNELKPEFLKGTERVENTAAYIPDYRTTTSDHFPVWVRFKLTAPTTSGAAVTPADQETGDEKPNQVILEQNYPNPFNPVTNITFSLPEHEVATLTIYNILGQQVAEPVDHKVLDAGSHTFRFDGTNLPSGIYFYRLETSTGVVMTRKMTLLK